VEIKRLSDLNFGRNTESGRAMNVCIVSSDFVGPVKTGIATVTSALARQLIADGHDVTLLYTYVGNGKPVSGAKPWQHWVNLLAAEGVELKHIQHDGDYRAWREASWRVKEFIEQSSFDFVYFNDHYGSGYYSLLAKRYGISPFCDQLHCVITHGAMEWVFNLNGYYASRLTDVEWMGIERRSTEMADVVIAPSIYLLREYVNYGWQLPAQKFHQFYPIIQKPISADNDRRMPIGEIVFFGRLEIRKGLLLFCEALDALAGRFPRTDITFLGEVTDFSGMSSALQIINRSARWPFQVRLLNDLNQDEALSYLRKPGRLAVMPSLADNSPCAVYECMEEGIPFVSTRGSGIEEIVHESCWNDVLVQPNVQSLTEKLKEILEHGARTGRPSFDPAKNLATWSAWHGFVAGNRAKLTQMPIIDAATRGSTLVNSKLALVVVIDNGTCSLSLLIENLSSHIRRFAGRATFLVLSLRRGELRDALLKILNANFEGSTVPLSILDPRDIREARDIISASEYVFFTEAETEILTSFFILALGKLQAQERAVVSSVVATRRSGEISIEELPTGDIPGLAALGEPIGGSSWAVTAASLAEDLSSLELYDAQLDALTPSWVMGQLIMQRCRAKGVSIHVLPIVGAVETRENGETRRHMRLSETRRIAEDLGISPTVCKGGAPWFAVSAFGAHVEPICHARLECAGFLPAEHPYFSAVGRTRSEDREKMLPELAAALGRAELSLQLESAAGLRPGRTRDLIDIATRAMRFRPVWDLLPLLEDDDAFEFGLALVPTAPVVGKKSLDNRTLSGPRKHASADRSSVLSPGSDTAARPLPRERGHAYVDARRLQIKRNRIYAIANLRLEGPGSIFIVDVPLCGHARLVAKLRLSTSSDPLLVRLTVIDQEQGDEIATSSARLIATKLTELSVALHNVYGRALVALEFDEAEKMEVLVESIRVE
jgi:glycosyltransferase involved in cell wall biosynthesis